MQPDGFGHCHTAPYVLGELSVLGGYGQSQAAIADKLKHEAAKLGADALMRVGTGSAFREAMTIFSFFFGRMPKPAKTSG